MEYYLLLYVQEISKKTTELLNNLRSLATETEDGSHVIQLETLKERKMAAATESFLFSLAACEGLVEVWETKGGGV